MFNQNIKLLNTMHAYRPVIEALGRLRSVPFSNYLVDCQVAGIAEPEYLRQFDRGETKVDASTLVQDSSKSKTGHLIDSGDVYRALLSERKDSSTSTTLSLKELLSPKFKCRLNVSQLEAFQSCLTQELSLIQGPPGTGKSFVGKSILSFLIHNQFLWRRKKKGGPILVVCYTNQALDNILEDLVSVTGRIVRVGGRSSCEALEKHNLTSIKRAVNAERIRDSSYYKAEKELGREMSENLKGSLFSETLKKASKTARLLDDLRSLESAELLRRADVVGMTTTGAAKNREQNGPIESSSRLNLYKF
jgi:hypothetical protein